MESDPVLVSRVGLVIRRIVQVRWWVVGAIAALAMIAIIPAMATTGAILAADPCAGPYDNVWATVSSALLWVAFFVAASLTVAGFVRGGRDEGWGGVRVMAYIVVLSLVWFFLAAGPYGWHCPDM